MLIWKIGLVRVSTRRRRVFKINVMVIANMWKLVGLLTLIFGLRWWSQKIFFLAPPSGQNPKLKFPFTWILAKPEVTKWPEMKPEVSYRLNLSRNFLEWMKKASMSHTFWLIIMIKFCLWLMNFRMSFLSSRRRY